jgi:hypothetical protein
MAEPEPFGMRQVGLFVTGLQKAERIECYRTLLELRAHRFFSIPFVHAVSDIDDAEYAFCGMRSVLGDLRCIDYVSFLIALISAALNPCRLEALPSLASAEGVVQNPATPIAKTRTTILMVKTSAKRGCK